MKKNISLKNGEFERCYSGTWNHSQYVLCVLSFSALIVASLLFHYCFYGKILIKYTLLLCGSNTIQIWNSSDNVNIDNNDVWKNENFQRNAISRGINYIKDLSQNDVIIISDLDEIPDPYTLDKIKKGDIIVDINILEMDLYYYNLNTKFKSKWLLCKIISYKKYNELNIRCNDIRNTQCSTILNGGWHLSYFGDKYFIQNKIQNFSHQELNNANYTDLDKIENRVTNSSDLYDRDYCQFQKIKIENNTYLPPDYDKYLNKYYI